MLESVRPTRAPRFRTHGLRTAAIAGLGHRLGDHIVDNRTAGVPAGVDDAWLRKRTGVRRRRAAADGQTTRTLAADAGRAALEAAGVAPASLDLVIVGTFTPEATLPHVAPTVAADLGTGAGAFDVGAACCGFLSGLLTGAALIESGRADRVLVIGADTVRAHLDPTDRGTTMFADGAGAAVLVAGAGGGVVRNSVLHSDGDAAELIAIPTGGRLFMDGHETFRRAVGGMVGAARDVCDQAAVALEEIDLVVPHQANARIAAAVGERLGIDPERVFDDIAEVGNTSAGSIPIALSRAAEQDRLPDDGLVLLAAFGSGLSWGAALIDWRAA